jgi:citrate lyase subunit beta/citryl-CoA lyase
VPAHPRTLAKARGLEADELVLDLEDAVPAGEKEGRRELLVQELADPAWRGRTLAVRVNAPGTPWFEADLAAVAELAGSIVVPKTESPEDVLLTERLLGDAPVRIQALVETARGLRDVAAIAGSSDRLEALIIGYADLAASLGRRAATLDDWRPAQDALLVAARAAGVEAIDGPHLSVSADAAFEAELEQARRLGFDGKWAIHPAQVAAIRAAFTPAAEELHRAERVLAAVRAAEGAGRGAIALDGEMLDAASVRAAERVLARAGAA